jgi:hypothetical protein
MAGAARRAGAGPGLGPLNAMNSLSNNLSTGAFHMRITRAAFGVEQQGQGPAQSGAAAPRPGRADTNHFVIEGLLK